MVAEIKLAVSPTYKQNLFLECPADEILYGGSLGGGKTFIAALKGLMLCTTHKKLRVGLFRKTLPELRESLIKEVLNIYPPALYKFRMAERKLIIPFNGSQITFNFVDNDKDLIQYQGQEFDVIIIDEAINFTPYQIAFLKTRLRSPKPNFRVKIYYLTNPIGVSYSWMKARFIDDKEPMKLYPTPETMHKPKEEQQFLCFIPARLQDNPHLTDNDPGYIDRLQSLPEAERKALIEGSWDIKAGVFFPEFEKDIHVIDRYVPRTSDTLFMSMDFGTAKPSAIHFYAVQQDGAVIMYKEIYTIKGGIPDEGSNASAVDLGQMIVDSLEDFEKGNIKFMVLDNACWAKVGHIKTIAEIIQEKLNPFKIPLMKCTKDRVNGLQNVRSFLLPRELDGNPSFLVCSCCTHIIRTMPGLIMHKQKSGDIDLNQEDHSLDSLYYFLNTRPAPKKLKSGSSYPHNSGGWWIEKMKPKKLT